MGRERESERERTHSFHFGGKKNDPRGNPAEKQFYDCISAYAPVDNVVPGAKYPTILVTAGLHDPRVGYWEPAKVEKEDFSPPILFFPQFFFSSGFFRSKTNCTPLHFHKTTKNEQWVARIRELGQPRGPVIFKCDLGAGHFSKSGRFDRLSEVALEHAFLLKAFGLLRAERKAKK
jgi:oligopeptidase B